MPPAVFVASRAVERQALFTWPGNPDLQTSAELPEHWRTQA